MANKYKTSKTKKDIEELAAIDCKAQRVPSPSSMLIGGKYVNVCPKCHKPCSDYPWTCPACGWTAAKQPELCACQAVHPIIETEDGEYAYPVDAEHEDSPILSADEKAKWRGAKDKAKDAKDVKVKVA